MKGNYGPGDASRLIPNGAIVSVQVFLGHIETHPLWYVLNGFFISGRSWEPFPCLARE